MYIALGVGAAVLVVLAAMAVLYWVLLQSMYPEELRTNETYTLTTPDLWKLRLCRYRQGRAQGEPVLLVHGLGANQHNFTIPPEHSIVDTLVERGYDCWTIDLRGARSSQPPFGHSRYSATFDDYLLHDLPAAIEFICKHTGYAQLHWIGHSMGGMLLFAYAATHGDEAIASGTAMGSPVGAPRVSLPIPGFFIGIVNAWPGFATKIARSFVPLGMTLRFNPLGLIPINLRNVHPKIVPGHFFNAVEEQQPGVINEMLHWAKTKEWRVDNDQINVLEILPRLEFPLFIVCAAKDPFCDAEITHAWFEDLPAKDKRKLVLSKAEGYDQDYHHVDLAFGRNGRKDLYDPICDWLKAHPILTRYEAATTEEKGAAPLPVPPEVTVETRERLLTGATFAHLQAADPPGVAEEMPAMRMPQRSAIAPESAEAAAAEAAPIVHEQAPVLVPELGQTPRIPLPDKGLLAQAFEDDDAPAAPKRAPKKSKPGDTPRIGAPTPKRAAKPAAKKKSASGTPAGPSKGANADAAPPKKAAARKSAARKAATDEMGPSKAERETAPAKKQATAKKKPAPTTPKKNPKP